VNVPALKVGVTFRSMPGPPPQLRRYSLSCGDERSCCESSEIQAKAIDRVCG